MSNSEHSRDNEHSRNNKAITERFAVAKDIVRQAAVTALELFRDPQALQIDAKGRLDWVSNADRTVETQIRDALQTHFPADGIIGEEHGSISGETGFTWIIDPIDGTSSYISNMPGWCVVLACVDANSTVIGVICDPVANETWTATAGGGACLNDLPTRVSAASSLEQGSTAIGHNTRIDDNQTLQILEMLLQAGGKFYTSGSGALMLTYVASGRLLGYCEPHMNAWDCMAALLIIEEAGGLVQKGNHARMMLEGGRVIAGAPGVYNNLLDMSERAYGPFTAA